MVISAGLLAWGAFARLRAPVAAPAPASAPLRSRTAQKSGRLLGSKLKLTLRLHETKDGRLLSTAVASGKSVDDLGESAGKAADELMAPLR